MKKIIYKFSLALLTVALLISCSDDDKSSNEPETENGLDQSLVGTWVLTKILAPIPTTPEAVGIALTVLFNDDGTMELTSEDTEGTSVYSGTWSTLNEEITITLEGSEPGKSPYTINGNIATITQFPVEFQGSTILASLEFTKSP